MGLTREEAINRLGAINSEIPIIPLETIGTEWNFVESGESDSNFYLPAIHGFKVVKIGN